VTCRRGPRSSYAARVIRNPHRLAHHEERAPGADLRRMTMEESIALGEALLTSEVMSGLVFPDDDRPVTLARALGIPRRK
jgi:hypothetical protein